VWFGVASANGQGVTRRECFAGDREAVRRQATAYALNLSGNNFYKILDTV
jgi:nicotinamide-nucleotide amidase